MIVVTNNGKAVSKDDDPSIIKSIIVSQEQWFKPYLYCLFIIESPVTEIRYLSETPLYYVN